jgi:hypothetical protein
MNPIKKTPYVWVIIILDIISIILGGLALLAILGGGAALVALGGASIFSGAAGIVMIIGLVITLVSVVLQIVYLVKLIKMRGDLVKWTHIVFGLSVLGSLVGIISSSMSNTSIVGSIVGLVITGAVWFTFAVHLKKVLAGGAVAPAAPVTPAAPMQ